jgi:hypothetical protein
MSDKKVRASARVALTVEVTVGTWDEAATVAEISKAAAREATEHLEKLVLKDSQTRIVSKPTVQVVMVKDDGLPL